MTLTLKQLWQLDNLLIKCTGMNTMEKDVIEERELIATGLEKFLADKDTYEHDLNLWAEDITTERYKSR